MAALSIPDFMKGLPALDANMKPLSEEKLTQGKVLYLKRRFSLILNCKISEIKNSLLIEVLRYLASVDVKGGCASVGIEAVDRNSPFGLLQGSANMLTVVTDQ